MNKEGLANYPRALVQLINKKFDENVCPDQEQESEDAQPLDEEVASILAQGRRFRQDDVDKVERVAHIMGRCHEMVNKIESLFGMRNDIRQMDYVSNTILNQIESNRQNFGNLQ
mmetsp:Transcript_14650/g.18421  ORF Transcript_14650/g.18421 Transcript_14650/m.18421 type:complete len:114 (+) Transcript_14650:261-602(+)